MIYKRLISSNNLQGEPQYHVSGGALLILGINWIDYSVRNKFKTLSIEELLLIHVKDFLEGGVFDPYHKYSLKF